MTKYSRFKNFGEEATKTIQRKTVLATRIPAARGRWSKMEQVVEKRGRRGG
jgi:hypothetical protein